MHAHLNFKAILKNCFFLIFSLILLIQSTFVLAQETIWKIDPQSGLLNVAKFCYSPNFDKRSDEQAIDLLVIHNISLPKGEFGSRYVHDLFTNKINIHHHPSFKSLKHLKVSSHLFIRRDGEIWQFVPFHKMARHAGKSSFEKRKNCNDYSIGIEMEGTDEIPYTLAQYKALAKVTILLMQTYPKITANRIVGHSDIAPGRKTDPGHSFNWPLYFYVVELTSKSPDGEPALPTIITQKYW